MKAPGGREPERQPRWKDAKPYAWLSLCAFVGSVLLIVLLISQAGVLVQFGLVGSFYFLALVPLGLCVGAFLFGAMRSFARYKGKQFGGWLELGGPVVGFMLVIMLGFSLSGPAPPPFDLTVFVHGPDGAFDLPLRHSGEVTLRVKSLVRHERIGDDGRATFASLPAEIRSQKALVGVEADGFETVSPAGLSPIREGTIDVVVRRRDVTLIGGVLDADEHPIADALVLVGKVQTRSDANGQFSLQLPGAAAVHEIEMIVRAAGYQPYSMRFVVGDQAAKVMLRKEPR